jgi:hypothetical protein
MSSTGNSEYRDGHWAWIDPWGWTWVDDAPWGFAVSHYGRWTNLRGSWGWVPGPAQTRAYYAPAVVAFVGGSNFQLAISSGVVGGVAWFPLGPRDVYRPAYAASRGYYENINRSNTVINNTVINNTYNNSNVTDVVYANRRVPGAVVAVPTTTFVQSQPVSRAVVRISQETMVSVPVAVAPSVAPTEKSVHGAAAQGAKPPTRVFERPVVARTAPPAAHVGSAGQQSQLSTNPGTPLDDAARKGLKPAPAMPVPVVKVLSPPREASQAMRPPPSSNTVRDDARARPDDRSSTAAPAIPGAAAAPQPVRATQPLPAAQPPEQRPNPEQGGKSEQRERTATPPPAHSQGTTQPKVAPPQATPPASAAQSPEPRDRPEPRGQPIGRNSAPPQNAAEPRAVAPQHAPPAPEPQSPPQRSAQPKAAPPTHVASPAPASAPPHTAPRPEPSSQEPDPAAGRANENRRDRDEQKNQDGKHRQEK